EVGGEAGGGRRHDLVGERGAALDRPGIAAGEDRDRILLLGDLAPEVGAPRPARIPQSLGTLGREAAVAAGLMAEREQLVHLLEDALALGGDGELAVELAQA